MTTLFHNFYYRGIEIELYSVLYTVGIDCIQHNFLKSHSTVQNSCFCGLIKNKWQAQEVGHKL